jgi:hypothetical protein
MPKSDVFLIGILCFVAFFLGGPWAAFGTFIVLCLMAGV